MSESLHSQGHQGSQDTSHMAHPMQPEMCCPWEATQGLESQKRGRRVSSTGEILSKKDSKEDGLKRVQIQESRRGAKITSISKHVRSSNGD